MICFYCRKEFPIPFGTHVSIFLLTSDDISSLRLGELHFHPDCFKSVAGASTLANLNGPEAQDQIQSLQLDESTEDET